MKVLITGGTGLIGKALAQSFSLSGDQVWILSRNPEKAHVVNNVQLVRWDGRSSQGWGQLINDIDVLINLAGENIGAKRWTATRKEKIRDSRLKAGEAVVSAVRQGTKRPQVLVQASAVGYYGTDNDLLLDEVSPPGTDFLSGICLAWEASTKAVENLGIRRVVIRTGIVLDRHEGALARMLLPFRLFVGGPLGGGKQWMPWIHLKDEVAAIRFLINNPEANGIFNLTSPNPLSNAEFGKLIAKILKRPYWLPIPPIAMRLLLGEMSTLVLDGQRPLPRRLLAMRYQFYYDEAQEALMDILRKK